MDKKLIVKLLEVLSADWYCNCDLRKQGDYFYPYCAYCVALDTIKELKSRDGKA